MIRLSFRILIALAATMFLSSCVETIVMDPYEDLPVYVHCLLKGCQRKVKYSVHDLDLYYVKGKSKSEYIPVDSAKAYLVQAYPHDTIGYFRHIAEGKWQLSKVLSAGKEYHLYIEIPGREKIQSTTIIPDNFYVVTSYADLGITEADEYGTPTGEFKSAPNPHNIWISAKYDEHTYEEDLKSDYMYLTTDNPYADNFNITGLELKDMDFSGTPDAYYTGFWNLINWRQKCYPNLPLYKDFIRIALPANFSNGLSDSQKDTYQRSKLFEDSVLICCPLECPTERPSVTRKPYKSHYDIYSFSDEYDKFLRDVYVKQGKLEHDLTAVYSSENIYTNIEGGIGIFGSYIHKFSNVYYEF